MFPLFHVSPVLVSLLDPLQATGKRKVVWLCALDKLEWTINHVADHKGTDPNALWVYSVNEADTLCKPVQWCRQGIYYSATPIIVHHVRSVPCRTRQLERAGRPKTQPKRNRPSKNVAK